MSWLRNYHVIIILTCYIVDMKVFAIGIDAVSIQWKHGHCSYQIEPLKYIQLRRCIYLNIKVIQCDIDCLVQVNVIVC